MTYIIEKLNSRKIRVTRSTMFNDYYEELTLADTELIDNWVVKCELGRRIAWDQWQLNNDHAISLFLLKWKN